MAMTSENASDADASSVSTWRTRWSDITNFTNASFEIRRLSDKSLSYDLENNADNADNAINHKGTNELDNDDDDDDRGDYENNANNDDDGGNGYDDNGNDNDDDYDDVNDDANDDDWKLVLNAGSVVHANRYRRRNEPFYINNQLNISHVCPPSPSSSSAATLPPSLTRSDPHIYSGL